ncbi:MAG: DegT/DnrJ/EryC1/StrS aminotransferase family protein [Verrucomicrobiota bacterium]
MTDSSGTTPDWLPLLRPDMPSPTELAPFLEKISAADQFTNFGPLSKELEADLAPIVPGPNDAPTQIVTTSSGTLALELTLLAFELPPNSPILIPSLTFPATATAVIRAGHTPVFADVDPDTWTLSPGLAQSTPNPFAAALPVAIFGHPINPLPWDDFTSNTNRPVLIDAASAFGNQSIGNTTVTAFSLHTTKTLSAGEGGFVAAHDAKLIESIRTTSNFGFVGEPGTIISPGTNSKLSEYHAAVALANLQRWQHSQTQRTFLAETYACSLTETLGDRVALHNPETLWTRSVFVVRLPNQTVDQTLVDALAKDGIESRRWYHPPLHEHPAFADYPRAGELAVTCTLAKELIGLPFHLKLTTEDIHRVVAALDQHLA